MARREMENGVMLMGVPILGSHRLQWKVQVS
jgi:hypothetical protein